MTRILTAILILGLAAVPYAGTSEASPHLTGDPDYTRDDDHSYSIEQEAAVKVSHSMGNLTVSAWQKDEVRVQARVEVKGDEAKEFGEKIFIEVDESDGQFNVMTRFPKGKWGKLSFAVTLDVRLPASHALTAFNSLGTTTIDGMLRDVTAKTSNGNLDVQHVRGNLTLTASLGNTTIRTCEGAVDVSGHSGNVEIEDVRGDVTALSALGQIKISNVSGNITANSANGSVKARGLSYRNERTGEGNRLEINSSIGSIEIALPTPPSFQLLAATTLGTIESEFQLPDVVKGVASETCDAKLGEGLATISLKTTNGGIRISKENGEN